MMQEKITIVFEKKRCEIDEMKVREVLKRMVGEKGDGLETSAEIVKKMKKYKLIDEIFLKNLGKV